MKKVIVLSLGGSLIVPDEVDIGFLKKFKNTIKRHTKRYKFLIACGGGNTARKYIGALKKAGLNARFQSLSGISATRMNARFMNYLFSMDPELGIPHTLETLKKYSKKRDIVFFGALEYKPEQTSDSTAAEASAAFKADFINLTDVAGLYTKDPRKHKDAKLIPKIGWKDFHKMACSMGYKPGQHFVLDQTASGMILRHKIPTYILGQDLKQLDHVLGNRGFRGTLIEG